MKKLPTKYQKLWKACLPILKKGRPDDEGHAIEVADFILNCGKKNIDIDVLIPVAVMHDIGHSAILPEHFKYITGQERVRNGKLVHMLVGQKLPKKFLKVFIMMRIKFQKSLRLLVCMIWINLKI